MHEKYLKTLEYHKIIGLLAAHAKTPMGKKRVETLLPSVDINEISQWQKETSEAASVLLKKGSIPLGGVKDVTLIVKRAQMGGSLTMGELLLVAQSLYIVKRLKNYYKWEGRQQFFESLDGLFSGLTEIPKLQNEIERCILSDSEMADDASGELRNIRREIKVSGEKVKGTLNQIIHAQDHKTMLQDAVITMRNGRYCVPVKQEYKNLFKGMIHDQSATGATLFIEPMSVVNLNNAIRELLAKEKNEMEKILFTLSALVGMDADVITANIELMGVIDFIFAKGGLSLALDATEPEFNTDGYIDIKKGRHPLLSKEAVIPIDIYLGEKFTTLLITGPNTGGKTVALKTLGLFTLLGQAGLHIPAFDHSRLAVFDNVFADIGDEQSIEQSLSTFSSHMTNIIAILSHVTKQSLVLFDELGAGTDPTEGAALAMSILKSLHKRNIRTAATTHYSELKVYALNEEGCENASCEFDVETLRPTYKLLIGIPGKSNAFAISKKLGLSDSIIEGAKEFLSQEEQKFEDVITDLEINKKSILYERDRAEQFRREAEKLNHDIKRQKESLLAQKEKILTEAREEARNMLVRAKEECDAVIKEINKGYREAVSQHEMNQQRQKLNDAVDVIDKELHMSRISTKNYKPIINLQPGDKVYVKSFNRSGRALAVPAADGSVMVEAGGMKIKINITELLLDENKAPSPHITTAKTGTSKSYEIKPEVDLRGMTTDEAYEVMDKYLDDAYLARLEKVFIIHGKGTGVLRESVQKRLKRHPHVKSFRLGRYGEGEAGVTVVELK